MPELVTVYTTTYPHEAHIVKSILEAEGIEIFIKDELTTQVHNFLSNAIGGTKLQVYEKDLQKTTDLLIEKGYIQKSSGSSLLEKVDKILENLPFLSNLGFEMKLLLALIALVLIFVIPLVIFLL